MMFNVTIIKDLDFFLLSGSFSGTSHPDNQGLAVLCIIFFQSDPIDNNNIGFVTRFFKK